MPLTLLPASAAAFAPRSAPTIVLGSRVETWLTHTLKRVNRRRPLNNVNQQHKVLTEVLSGENALWTLASIMVPKSPDSDLKKDENALVEALFNYQLIHIEAYVVHVDMVSQHEIAYKLTQDTIEALIEYHKDIYSVDVAASTWKWPEKDSHLKKLQEEFKQAVNKFVYRTGVRALEGLEEDGAGELLEGRSSEVKEAVMALFLPLLPPPPRIVEVVQPAPIYHYASGQWYQATPISTAPVTHLTAPVDPWKVLGSTPSPTTTSGETFSSPWSTSPLDNNTNNTQSVSPASSYGQPHSASSYYDSPHTMAPPQPLPLPSALVAQCGSTAVAAAQYYNTSFSWNQNDIFQSQQNLVI